MESKILKKFYSKEDNLFHIIKSNPKGDWWSNIENTYDNFNDFYIAVKKDLKNADLLDYEFDDCDVSKYDLSKSIISSKTMIKIGKYDNKIEKLINQEKELIIQDNETTIDLVKDRKQVDTFYCDENDEDVAICYLSDLHINHKLIKKYKNNAVNKYELNNYLKSIVIQLKESLPKFIMNIKIILIGDFSLNFDIFKQFFKIYSEIIGWDAKTFFILGNHELWDEKLIKKCDSIENIVEEYRNFLKKLTPSITLLENQLYLPNGVKKYMM